MGDRLMAPFSDEVVWRLARFQATGYMHPFTCGRRGEHFRLNEGLLIPTNAGWICPVDSCGYTQDWAYDFMIDDAMFARMAAARKDILERMTGDWPRD